MPRVILLGRPSRRSKGALAGRQFMGDLKKGKETKNLA